MATMGDSASAVSEPALVEIVTPVVSAMDRGPLREALLSAFYMEKESLGAIYDCFAQLASKRHASESLKFFFHSWSKTNHSAASVSGLANRITLLARKHGNVADRAPYYLACDSLQRVTDEDLGARGGTLHSDLFYRMATTLCGDDSWLLRVYCLERAQEFMDWVNQQRLREREIVTGLLTTLVHEVYTHGEVELIHPMFEEWVKDRLALPADEARRVLTWVKIHTGGTESDHFRHATNAVHYYCEASGIAIDPVSAEELFRGYLQRKAAVMTALMPKLH